MAPPYNPYAPPQQGYGYGPMPMPMPMPMYGAMGAMQVGNALAVPKGMQLPGLCCKCGKPHDLMARNQSYSFAPQWVLVFLFFGIIGFIIAAIVISSQRKTAQFVLPICQSCNARWEVGRRNILIMALGIPVATVALSILAGAIDSDLVAFPILIGILAWAIAPIAYHLGSHRKNTIWSGRIDDMVAYLSGFGPDAAQAILTQPSGPIGYGGAPMAYPQMGGYGPPPGYGGPPGYGPPPGPQW